MRHPFALVLALALLALPVAGCGDDAGGNPLVGSYSMDVEDFRAKVEEKMLGQVPGLDQMPPEQVEKIKEQMLASFKDAAFDVEVKADGTFTGKSTRQGETDLVSGTWTQEGDVVTFVAKEQNGEPTEDDEPMKATLKDGNLVLQMDGGMPPMVMKKN